MPLSKLKGAYLIMGQQANTASLEANQQISIQFWLQSAMHTLVLAMQSDCIVGRFGLLRIYY